MMLRRLPTKYSKKSHILFVIDGNELMVTTSIGIALYPADGNDIDALLKNADIAMYNAKDTGETTINIIQKCFR